MNLQTESSSRMARLDRSFSGIAADIEASRLQVGYTRPRQQKLTSAFRIHILLHLLLQLTGTLMQRQWTPSISLRSYSTSSFTMPSVEWA